MMMPSAISTERRISRLEADAYRAQQHHEHVHDRLEHVTGALGDLSQDMRGTGLDVREMREDVTDLGQQVREMRTDITELKQRFGDMESLMRAIAVKVGAAAPGSE